MGRKERVGLAWLARGGSGRGATAHGDELHDSGHTRGGSGCCVVLLGWDKTHLAVGRLPYIVSGALQRRGPSSGAPSGCMEGACGVNAESKDAEYSAEHHLSGKGGDAKCETYEKKLCFWMCTYAPIGTARAASHIEEEAGFARPREMGSTS